MLVLRDIGPYDGDMTYSPDELTLPVRQEVLLEGLDDWVALGTVHRYVAHENAGEDVSVIQTKVLELIRELASEGLYEIGDQLKTNVNHGRFTAWNVPVDEAIERIRETYVGRFDDPFQWSYICSLQLTDKGEREAEALGHEVGYFTPPPTVEEIRAEQQRLASAASLVGVVAGCVDDFRHINAEEAPALASLGIPAGWQRAQPGADVGVRPVRMAVYGQYPDGRWNACETVALFGFTGCPPEQVVYDNSDCALRDLREPLRDMKWLNPLVTEVLTAPECPGVIAVRSTGSFHFCQRWMHARYYTYIACSPEPGRSRMLQQVLIFDSTLEEPLAVDLTSLTDTAYQAFIAAANAS